MRSKTPDKAHGNPKNIDFPIENLAKELQKSEL